MIQGGELYFGMNQSGIIRGKIRNLETAKLAAFEMYDKLHDR